MENETIGLKDKNLIKKKAQYYFDNYIEVHLTLDNNKFLNGFILDIGADFIIFNDRKLKDMIVFFSEITDLLPYETKSHFKNKNCECKNE